MRVLIIIDDLRRAGAQRVILQEIRALHPATVEFAVVTLARVPEPSFVRELAMKGIVVQYIGGSGLCDVRRLLAVYRAIRRFRPDLVHTHLTYANILGVLAARLAGCHVIASLHNFDSNQLRWPACKRWVEGVILRHWASVTLVVSEGARTATMRNFGVNVNGSRVLPNALDPTVTQLRDDFNRELKRRELGVQPREHLVCSVARLDPTKGHHYLVEAIAQLDRSVRLVLVGGGPEASRIRELAVRLGIEKRVTLLGVREDVGEILAASDLFVLPSLNEGLSQALLEAMALAIPVVATNVGGTPDVLQPGRTGWCARPGQTQPLADAIRHALDRPSLSQSYARAARVLVTQRFSLEAHTAQLQSLYRSVVAG